MPIFSAMSSIVTFLNPISKNSWLEMFSMLSFILRCKYKMETLNTKKFPRFLLKVFFLIYFCFKEDLSSSFKEIFENYLENEIAEYSSSSLFEPIIYSMQNKGKKS